MMFGVLSAVAVALLAAAAYGVYVVVTRNTPDAKANVRENATQGKTIVITGANTGIGKATALALAKGGGRIILACRSKPKAEAAAEEIQQATGNSHVEVAVLDLSDRSSVFSFANAMNKTEDKVDILISNAGVVPSEFTLSRDGLELMWTVNHFNNFLLIRLMLSLLRKSPSPRIVLVNSGSHRVGEGLLKVRDDDLAYFRESRCFGWTKTYPETKLAALLCMRELSKRLKSENSHITINAVNPGPVSTEIHRNAPGVLFPLIDAMMQYTFKSPAKGAETSVYAAVSDELDGTSGLYYDQCKLCAPAHFSLDGKEAQRWWNNTCRVLDIDPDTLDVDAEQTYE